MPDYSFLACLGRDPLAETWEAQTAEGKRRLVKFLYAAGGVNGTQEQEAVLHLQALRHPALMSLNVVPGSPGCRVLVTDLVETSLRSRFQEWQARGERGIPPSELLAHLQAAAEALDQLYQQHGLQHLDLNPSRLLLDGRRVLLGDFGLAQLVWLPAGVKVSQARCATPLPNCVSSSLPAVATSTALRSSTRRCSPAIIPSAAGWPGPAGPVRQADAECAGAWPGPGGRTELTGPGAGGASGDGPGPRSQSGEALRQLRRFRAGPATAGAEGMADTVRVTATPTGLQTAAAALAPTPREMISKLFHDARELCSLQMEDPTGPVAVEGETVEGRFVAILPPSNAVRKFDGFRQQWGAKLIESDEASALFRIGASRASAGSSWLVPRLCWSRCVGRGPTP